MKRLILVVDYNDDDELEATLENVRSHIIDNAETHWSDIDFNGSLVRPRVVMSFSIQEV